jgi:hypothetical protein
MDDATPHKNIRCAGRATKSRTERQKRKTSTFKVTFGQSAERAAALAEPAAQIKAAYRQKAKDWHPDRNVDNPDGAQTMMALINRAYALATGEAT